MSKKQTKKTVTLADMDPVRREESVLRRCQRQLATLDPDAQRRVMNYLTDMAVSAARRQPVQPPLPIVDEGELTFGRPAR